jgi:spermidine/putrescine transport system ATP-binding protein
MDRVADVELLEVRKSFGDVVAVDGVSLRIERGEFFSMLGPSGCGKTTTLRMIAGFEHPTAGAITIEGRAMGETPAFARNVNTVFQHYALFPHMTVAENVGFGLRMKGERRPVIASRVTEALELVRLAGYGQRRPRELSGGQQQRVAVARALVNRPAVLLLDEPLGALDLKLRKEMQAELKHLQKSVGITFVYVTHDQEEALTMSDRIAVMNGGRVVQCGSPEEIYERPATRFVADFIGESNFIDGTICDLDASRAGIDVPGAGRIGATLHAPSTATVGSPATIAIRPESVHLAVADSGQAQLRGRIAELVYRGSDTDVVVRVADHVVIKARQPRGATAPGSQLDVGTTVSLSWDPDHARVLTVGT